MIQKKVLRAFPPPDFLDIPYAGISISDDSVRCIQFSKKNNLLRLEKFAEAPLKKGVVSSGIVQDGDELSRVLQTFRNDLDIRFARVSLPEEKAYLFSTDIPLVSPSEVKSTIGFKIEENVPLTADDVLFDYIVTNPSSYVDTLHIIVSAVPKNIVNMYVDAVERAGISILSLEAKSQAIARALSPENTTNNFIVVHFCPGKIGLYIISHNVVHFTSTITSDGESLESPAFLSNEIKKLNIYWDTLKEKSSEEDKTISQIIICGENIGEKVVPYLSIFHRVPVVLGNVWTNAFDINTVVPPIPFVDSLRYAPAVGLAIPTDMLI